MKMEMGAITWPQWCMENLKSGSNVGYNPFLYGAGRSVTITEQFLAKGIEFKPIETDFVDKLWKDKPELSDKKIIEHEVSYAGRSVEQKLHDIGVELKKLEVSNHVVCSLEQIAWTLNIRGFDCDVTPYVVSYLILNYNFEGSISWKGTLYINSNKLSPQIEEHLKKNNIAVKTYEDVVDDVSKLEGKVYLDMDNTNAAIYNRIQNKDNIVKKENDIIEVLKGIKNPREVKGFADCHIRDGAAIVRYFAWMDHQLNVEKRTDIDEYQGWIQLEKFRSE